MKDKFTSELYPDEKILWTGSQKNGKLELWIGLIFLFAFFGMMGFIIFGLGSSVDLSQFILAGGVILIGVLVVYRPMMKNGGMESYAITNKRMMIYGYTNVELSKKRKRGQLFETEMGCKSYFFDKLSFTESNDEMCRVSLENNIIVLYQYDSIKESMRANDINTAYEILKSYIRGE